jgi:hypothetical protein
MFNDDNWSFSCFKSSTLQVIITLGGSPIENDDICIEYYVTVLNEDQQEVYQQNFNNIKNAILFANEKYGTWEFTKIGLDDTGGCGTCEAH